MSQTPTHISNKSEASDLNHYLKVRFDLYSLKELTTYFYGGDILGILALEMALVSKGLNDVLYGRYLHEGRAQ